MPDYPPFPHDLEWRRPQRFITNEEAADTLLGPLPPARTVTRQQYQAEIIKVITSLLFELSADRIVGYEVDNTIEGGVQKVVFKVARRKTVKEHWGG